MERTKEYSVVNDTLKALKNQGLSERYFQKGHSFSSKVLLVDLAGIELDIKPFIKMLILCVVQKNRINTMIFPFHM